MSPQLALFILVALLVVGWFALGTHWNVRKGDNALRWLQEGLPEVGEKTTLRWLGSSAVELKIQQARPPFRSAEIVLVLEPRDVPPLWAIAHLRGRRDLFIFRGTLRARPGVEMEAFDPRSWTAQGLEHKCEERRWTRQEAPAPLLVYAPALAASVTSILEASEIPGCPLVRLTVRRAEPEFEVQWQLDHLRKLPSPRVFETIRRIAGGLEG